MPFGVFFCLPCPQIPWGYGWFVTTIAERNELLSPFCVGILAVPPGLSRLARFPYHGCNPLSGNPVSGCNPGFPLS